MVKLALKFLLFSIFILGTSVQAQYEEQNWSFKPQIGVWFGPVSPMPGTNVSNALSTNLGTGLFFRANLPSNNFRTELGISYSVYTSDGPESLMSVPMYAAMSYIIPINLPLTFQAKLGGAANYLQNEPELKHNTHPALLVGSEVSFPAGKWVNIGIRIDYYYVYERYVSAPAGSTNFSIDDGQFLNFGLMVNFNLNP